MNQYAHMCRMDHVEIGHNDSESELCPLCSANNRADALAARVAELEAESLRHYSMAVAMFYSGKVDDLTGADCRSAADKIATLMRQPDADGGKHG